MPRYQSLGVRFWQFVDKSGPVIREDLGPCWQWTGVNAKNGHYGEIWVNFDVPKVGKVGKSEGAHRVSWRLHRGEIANGLCVLHRCDNRRCVNPDHLFLGTHKDNAIDREQKGRGALRNLPPEKRARGERHGSRTHPERILRHEAHPRAKLKEKNVREIRERLAAGESQRPIARAFGVSQITISRIARGIIWK